MPQNQDQNNNIPPLSFGEFIKHQCRPYQKDYDKMSQQLQDLTAEITRLREALERYEKVSEMIITTPSKSTANKEDLKQWQYTCIQMLESIK